MWVFVLFLIVVVMAAIIIFAVIHMLFSSRNAVPSVWTPSKLVDEVIDALELPESGVLYDLGCGDGRILAAATRQRPGIDAIGVDNDPAALSVAKMRLKGRAARLVRGQIMSQSLGGAARVFTYLGPGLMAELEPKLAGEMPVGSRLVSLQFPLPNSPAKKVINLPGAPSHAQKLYIYEY